MCVCVGVCVFVCVCVCVCVHACMCVCVWGEGVNRQKEEGRLRKMKAEGRKERDCEVMQVVGRQLVNTERLTSCVNMLGLPVSNISST